LGKIQTSGTRVGVEGGSQSCALARIYQEFIGGRLIFLELPPVNLVTKLKNPLVVSASRSLQERFHQYTSEDGTELVTECSAFLLHEAATTVAWLPLGATAIPFE
jgi:hypothetical protein